MEIYLIGVFFSILLLIIDYFIGEENENSTKNLTLYKESMIFTFFILMLLSWITVVMELYSLYLIKIKKD